MDWSTFWKWGHFTDYVEFLAAFAVSMSLLTVMFGAYSLYANLLGFASLLTEASLAVPQWLENHRKKSTNGMK